ncbi:MAG: recombinase family protein [Roseburia sp.]|nr:recombinase family protein [Roseburia sp.]
MSPRRGFTNATAGEKIAVIYARFSSHNQKDASIDQQVAACTAYAERYGYKVIKVYSDKAISGKKDNRPDFQRMMRDAQEGKFEYVIAWKSNRMGRNMLHAMLNESKLEDWGIKCRYTEESFEDNAAGRFALRNMMNVNQFYSEAMAEDIKRGMEDNARQCKVNGVLPLGYVKGEDGRYAIDEEEAAIVREVYERVLAGESFAEIAEDFNARGIKTKAHKKGTPRTWNKGSFHRMLTNDNYIGVYRHSGYVNEHGIPPIIEKEVFYKMQHHLATKKNPRGRHRDTADYLLTGKLFCGYCRGPMVGVSGTSRTGDKHFYYSCNTRRTKGECKKENVRKEFIEKTVAELTNQFILRDDVIEWIATNAAAVLEQSSSKDEIAGMEDELADARKAVKNVMAAIEQGIFTTSTKDRLVELETQISTLEQTILLAKSAREQGLIEKERIIWSLEQFRDGHIESKDYQKRLIDTFVRAVYLWDDKIEIHYYYAGEKDTLKFKIEKSESAEGGDLQAVLINSPDLHQKECRIFKMRHSFNK